MIADDSLIDASLARCIFADSGISVAEWARVRGFSTALVYQVLEGRRKCMRGQSHRIALALGLKQGADIGVEELSRRLVAAASGRDNAR